MRSAMILAAFLTLGACASAQPAGGYASYDALRLATNACAAKGGRLALVRNGNAKAIEDYACDKTKVSAK